MNFSKPTLLEDLHTIAVQTVDECVQEKIAQHEAFMGQVEGHACEVRERRAKVAPERVASKRAEVTVESRVVRGKLRPVGK
eukprot:2530582-Pyramimonas_sp.AAC.1